MMFYRLLLTFTMILVWGTTSWISIKGLSLFLPDAGMIIYAMGTGLELGKLLVITYIHRSWKDSNSLQKLYYSSVAGILIILTACEVIGYLAQYHMVSSTDTLSVEAELDSLQKENHVIREQLGLIESTMAGLPDTYVSKRMSIRKTTGYDGLAGRLIEISKKEAELTGLNITASNHAGPVYAIARMTGIDPEKAATCFIAILVSVIELLSAGLIVAVSSVWNRESHALEDIHASQIHGTEEPAQVEKESAQAEPEQVPCPERVQKPGTSYKKKPGVLQGKLKRIKERWQLNNQDTAIVTSRRNMNTGQIWLTGDG